MAVFGCDWAVWCSCAVCSVRSVGCGVVWCGVVRCGVVRCGGMGWDGVGWGWVEWGGVEWSGVGWGGVEWGGVGCGGVGGGAGMYAGTLVLYRPSILVPSGVTIAGAPATEDLADYVADEGAWTSVREIVAEGAVAVRPDGIVAWRRAATPAAVDEAVLLKELQEVLTNLQLTAG